MVDDQGEFSLPAIASAELLLPLHILLILRKRRKYISFQKIQKQDAIRESIQQEISPATRVILNFTQPFVLVVRTFFSFSSVFLYWPSGGRSGASPFFQICVFALSMCGWWCIFFPFSWLRPSRVIILYFFSALSIELRTVSCELLKEKSYATLDIMV